MQTEYHALVERGTEAAAIRYAHAETQFRLQCAAWCFGGPGFDADYLTSIENISKLLRAADHCHAVAACLTVWTKHTSLVGAWLDIAGCEMGSLAVSAADTAMWRQYHAVTGSTATPRVNVAMDALRAIGVEPHTSWPASTVVLP